MAGVFFRTACPPCRVSGAPAAVVPFTNRVGLCRPVSRARAAQQDIEQVSALTMPELVQLRSQLQKQLDAAIEQESYKEAADLKKQLEQINAKDPLMRAKEALEQAVKAERYEEAAKIKVQLKALEQELGPSALDSGLLSTSSTTITQGIRVHVTSHFVPQQSYPPASRFFFAYRVSITNTSKQVVQLRHRHWVIMDANGKVDEVRGPGVVGEQPILLPGKSFEYTSGCPLNTSKGSMEGEYTMVVLSEDDGEWKETIEVKIGRFILSAEGPMGL